MRVVGASQAESRLATTQHRLRTIRARREYQKWSKERQERLRKEAEERARKEAEEAARKAEEERIAKEQEALRLKQEEELKGAGTEEDKARLFFSSGPGACAWLGPAEGADPMASQHTRVTGQRLLGCDMLNGVTITHRCNCARAGGLVAGRCNAALDRRGGHALRCMLGEAWPSGATRCGTP